VPGYEIRPIGPGEVDAFLIADAEAFQSDPHPADLAAWKPLLEPERTLAAFAGDAIVATSALLTRELTVPGGTVPMAAVTMVGVHSTHRGRGLLDRMMQGHLEAAHERGEPVAALWASEAGIYGRYGYGLATRVAELAVRSPEARLRTPAPERRPRAVEPAAARADLAAVYDAVRPGRPGLLARDGRHWDDRLWDPEHERSGAGRLRAAIQDGAGGEGGAPEGYALYAVRKRETDGRPDDVVELRELVAATPEAAAALWEHLLRMSLSRSLRWELAPDDEPLPHMLTDPRAAAMRLGDGLFVRVVDVPRALAARSYSAPVDVVLEVGDARCPWNAGRWRLAGDSSGATCERTGAAPDVSLAAVDAGAAYLGGTSLAVLAAAGRAEEHTAGALAAASGAFKGVREPWCAEMF
jgi:predicted acetyltransferase